MYNLFEMICVINCSWFINFRINIYNCCKINNGILFYIFLYIIRKYDGVEIFRVYYKVSWFVVIKLMD